jgi:hypothetical protein
MLLATTRELSNQWALSRRRTSNSASGPERHGAAGPPGRRLPSGQLALTGSDSPDRQSGNYDSCVNRTPPAKIRKELRAEVGFGCPVDNCGNPYLEWHHFDPPWSEREHHDPAGMVALCAEHHKRADAGAFSTEQLRGFKEVKAPLVAGRVDWMRNDLLVVVGGNFYYETPIAVQFRDQPVVWLNRDEDGYLLLNLAMLTTAEDPRATMQDNFWVALGTPTDLESPPSGKRLKVVYDNQDRLGVEFFSFDSIDDVNGRYPGAHASTWGISFPITAVEVQMKVGGTEIEFGARSTTLGGMQMTNCFMSHCGAGVVID